MCLARLNHEENVFSGEASELLIAKLSLVDVGEALKDEVVVQINSNAPVKAPAQDQLGDIFENRALVCEK